jgi:uncharacterized protein Usg
MSDFEDAWGGYRLTTAEILYHLPDHPLLLQTYVWQEFDKAPEYPRLQEFLKFWLKEIEGKLHSVKIGVGGPLMPNSVNAPNAVFLMH